MNTGTFSKALATVFSELIDGAPQSGGYMLNGGDDGLLQSLHEPQLVAPQLYVPPKPEAPKKRGPAPATPAPEQGTPPAAEAAAAA